MKIKSILTSIALAFPALPVAQAQNTVFTYQGRVLDSGTNCNGTGQFQFALVSSTNANHTAMATANISGGYVTSYNINTGGTGYVTAPMVTVFGGGGANAGGTANISGGVVISITVTNTGNGSYSSAPAVTVAPPPANISYTTCWSNDGTSENGSEPSAAVSVVVNNGLFTIVLGDTTQPNMMAINAALFNQPSLQLRIWFNDGVHGFAALSPVQTLTSAPYAIFANTASSLLNGLTIQPNTNGAPNVIGGSPVNFVSGGVGGATIGGGGISNYLGVAYSNSVTADYGTVSGGVQNMASGDAATVGGGAQNTVRGSTATVSGGDNNSASGGSATVSGGQVNTASTNLATVSGGGQNTASGDSATVGGGYGNTASGANAAVSGGFGNNAVANYAIVSGGLGNNASGVGAFVGGGGYDGTTSAGNTASGNASVVAGGLGNQATDIFATVPGGANNTAGGIYATAGGGFNNTASGGAATVAGGNDNTASADNATVGGGVQNITSGKMATVGGGFFNTAGGVGAFVGGGGFDGTTTLGNNAAGNASAVVGGMGNQATKPYATISGGASNTASGYSATVGGGNGNIANGDGAFVGGGGYDGVTYVGNNAGGNASIVAGGLGNQTTKPYATVSGGAFNTAGGHYATVAGGEFNSANGEYSFAAGQQALALNQGAFVWADSQNDSFYSTANDQFLVRAQGGVGIGTQTPTATLHVSSGGGVSSPQLRVDQTTSGGYARLRLVSGASWDVAVGGANVMNFYAAPTPGSAGTNILTLHPNGNASLYGTLAQGSDRAHKENLKAIDPQTVLAKVAALPITEWNYITETGVQHLGPMAQDFYAAFSLGADEKHITTIDEGGVALAAIQGLNQKVEGKEARVQEQETRIRNQAAEIAQLIQRLEALEKIIPPQKSN